MSEGPVESSGGRAAPERAARSERSATRVREVPRVVVRADLLPALSAFSLVAALGLPLGWVWSRLAPPQQSTAEGTGLAPLLVESYHEFDALAIFMLLGSVLGVLTAVVLWMVRSRRGPVIMIAGVLGSALAAWVGMRTGASFAAGLHPVPATVRSGQLVAVAPQVSTAWAVIAQPLAVALIYGLAASWNGFDDLGRRHPG